MTRTNTYANPRRPQRSRRGTFLILVIGALAMLALFSIIYISIGRADRQTSDALQLNEQLNRYPTAVADYIAQVIADDVFDLADDGAVREAWDYPYTEPSRTSDAGAVSLTDRLFTPSGDGDDPWLASTTPQWLNRGRTAPGNLDDLYLEQRDWLHISNFAPDGRFVNLRWLRNNFDAEPGTGTDANGLERLSFDLSLFDDQGDYTTNLDNGAAADVNRPAHFSNRQIGAFRAMAIPDGAGIRPNDPDYWFNEWADADGDGMADSRWIELADASDPTAIEYLVPRDKDYRYFIAVRAVDLSALVNVNTATDLLAEPTERAPLGMTPADVDLFRLLTMQDLIPAWTTPADQGYRSIQHPTSTTPANDAENYDSVDSNASFLLAEQSYLRLRQSIINRDLGGTDPNFQIFGPEYVDQWPPDPAGNSNVYTAEKRRRYYDFAGQPSGIGYDSSTRTDVVGRFKIPDLVELLTYRGVNDPSATSRLETVFGGITADLNDPMSRSLMRDNRTLDVERDSKTDDEFGPGNPFADNDAYRHQWADRRQFLTTESGARPIRATQFQTPLPNPLPVGAANPNVLSEADLSKSIIELLDDASNPSIVSATGGAGDDVNDIFRGYFNALAHYPTGSSVSPSLAWTDARYATQFYGHKGPEIPLRLSAHLTANLIDSYDEPMTGVDDPSTALTIVINRADATNAENDQTRFPWPDWIQLDEDTANASNEKLAMASTPTDAVTVFGIERQPFITEVASFYMYTDAPEAAGGDGEGDEWIVGVGPDPTNPTQNAPIIQMEATLSGTVSAANPDFIFQILAFQLHNPFDEDITLSNDQYDMADGDYYLEYAERFYKLSDLVLPANPSQSAFETQQPTVITIPAGESVVLWTIGETPENIDTRLSNLETAYGSGDPAYHFYQSPASGEWWSEIIDQQLAGSIADTPKLVPEINPASGARVTSSVSGIDLLSPTTNPESLGSVKLWRIRIDPNFNSETSTANLRENDQLIDRLHLPNPDDLRSQISYASDKIPSSSAGPDPTHSLYTIGDVGDNTGFSVMLWRSVRRPDDPGATTPAGTLPAWCVETKPPLIGQQTIGTITNVRDDAAGITYPGTGPTDGDYRGNSYPASGTLRDILAKLRQRDAGGSIGFGTPSPETFCTTIGEEPEDKSGNSIDTFLPGGGSYVTLYPRVVIDDDEFERTPALGGPAESVMRPADLLLPLAIGPWYDHSVAITGTSTEEELDKRWTTLSEALGLALGYQRSATGDPADPLLDFGGDTAVGIDPVLDRAALAIDEYVAYEDANSNGVFDPGAGFNSDKHVGPGIPMALTVMDQFSTRPEQFASLSSSTQGVININTAPVEVLRTLPMLSPPPRDASFSMTPDPATGLSMWPASDYWWDNAPGTPTHDSKSDIAASIVSYRDQIPMWANVTGDFIDFPPVSSNQTNPTETQVYAQGDSLGRNDIASIPDIREEPGFRSTGELFCVRDRTVPLTLGGYNYAHSIDRLGINNDTSEVIPEGLDPYIPSGAMTDGISDDLYEKLLIGNSVMNTVSVRSDVYAVWFLIHGYRRADVEGLRDSDPMVPSVQRRFLMVIDRSNVLRKGDKPKVLVLKELPL